MIAKAEKALAAAEAALEAVRRAGEEALKASDYDAAMQSACEVIAAKRRVMAARVDVELAAGPVGA